MKISFVIPLHNEEKNAKLAVERIIAYCKKEGWKFEVIPVDDRSSDSTGKILKSLQKRFAQVKPLFRKDDPSSKGNTMGKALVEGTRKASGDIIIWTMGDLADDPKTFGALVDEIKRGYDMVFGSRYMLGGSKGNLDLVKAFLSSWGTKLAKIIFQIKVHDITNAFRAFRKEVFDEIALTSSGFSISPEFAIRAHRVGFRLSEVPTTYTNRVEGVSNFRLFQMTKSYLRLYVSLLFSSDKKS
ncbi:glycosyltransferase [Candidatus Gottesmanbacteria bacterium]|nr:glycosyltransferase [Candidatus Gottesmanbacteria bacterium]